MPGLFAGATQETPSGDEKLSKKCPVHNSTSHALEECKKFKNDPEIKERYAKPFQDDIEKGYERKLSEEEVCTDSKVTWYLPHRFVINPRNLIVSGEYMMHQRNSGVNVLMIKCTQDPEVLATIPVEDRSPRFLELSENKLPTDRALGVTWDAQEGLGVGSIHLNETQLLQREQSYAKRSLCGILEDFSSRFQSETKLSFKI